MFGFANGLLAFLALAAVLDFLPVLRHRRSPAAWWGEERLLFTTRYASARQKYGAWAFLLGVMVYEFIVVFNNSMARENWPWLQTRVSPVLDWVMYLCFGFKILLGTKYNGRSMVCAGLLYFVARWVYFNGQNIWWLGLCVALLAAKDVPLRRVMKAFLVCGVPTLALVELLHFAGIIAPDAASERNGSYRLMFGYGHPNTFGGVVFGLLLAWVLLRRVKLTWPELAGVAAVGVFLMIEKKNSGAKNERSAWLPYAIGSALFAALTSILAKVGISNVESNLGTAIRTGVVLAMAWIIVFMKGKQSQVKNIDKTELVFIALSGLATGGSWLCYYYAIQNGIVSVVVPIDKLSILISISFSYFVFKEKLTKKAFAGLLLMVCGTLAMAIWA